MTAALAPTNRRRTTDVKRTLLTRGALLVAATSMAVTLSACGSDSDSGSSASGSSSSSDMSTSAPSSSAAMADQPFGAACSQVPADGAGSFEGMSSAPVATAASNNPVLSTLVQAVTAANLGDTLNSAQDITVLAPANPAFQAIPADTLNAVLADKQQLTTILTHHVIQGRLTPDQLAGTHTTLAGDQVTISGSGENFTIAGDATVTGTQASVICGNVQTANATVYIIDQVLKPAAG
jgi:uncharacterized surface protein with fasciclin (FAS1) repeats